MKEYVTKVVVNNKIYCLGRKCEESSPQFPTLQSMTEDVSKLELPSKPVLSSNSLPSDFDIPDLPELTTTNLQVVYLVLSNIFEVQFHHD